MDQEAKQRPWWSPWGALAAAGVVGLGVGWFAGHHIDSQGWGALGEWVGAAATITAVWTALHIANREAEASRTRAVADARERQVRAIAETRARDERAQVAAQERDNRARADAREREEGAAAAAEEHAFREASLVLTEMKAPGYDPHGVSPQWMVAIKNFGDKPVMQPRLENFIHPNGGKADWAFDDPTGFWEEYQTPDHLAPRGGDDWIPVAVSYDPPLSSEGKTWLPMPVISYTDHRGHRWRRVGNSMPEEVDPRNAGGLGGPDWYRAAHPASTRFAPPASDEDV